MINLENIFRYDVGFNIELNFASDALIPDGSYDLYDLWTGEYVDLGVDAAQYEYFGVLRAHATWAFKLIPSQERSPLDVIPNQIEKPPKMD